MRKRFKFVRKREIMGCILVDNDEKRTTYFVSKSDLGRVLGVSYKTMWVWSKEWVKNYKNFVIYFGSEYMKSGGKVRKGGFKGGLINRIS